MHAFYAIDDRCGDQRLCRTDGARDLYPCGIGLQAFGEARDAWVVAVEGEEVRCGAEGEGAHSTCCVLRETSLDIHSGNARGCQ